MGDVVRHDARVGVGRVLQLGGVADITQRPDARNVRAQIRVSDDVPVCVERHARRFDPELTTVGVATGGHEEHVAVHGASAAVGRNVELDVVADAPRRKYLGVRPDVESLM